MLFFVNKFLVFLMYFLLTRTVILSFFSRMISLCAINSSSFFSHMIIIKFFDGLISPIRLPSTGRIPGLPISPGCTGRAAAGGCTPRSPVNSFPPWPAARRPPLPPGGRCIPTWPASSATTPWIQQPIPISSGAQRRSFPFTDPT